MSETTEPVQSGQIVRQRHAGGRPPKLTPEERREVYEALEFYIDTEDDPTIVGFCAWNNTAIQYNVTRDNMNDWEEFSTLKARSIAKQEAFIIKSASENRINATFAIFRLKQPQHGWRDRVEQDITTGGDKIAMASSQAEQLLQLRNIRATN